MKGNKLFIPLAFILTGVAFQPQLASALPMRSLTIHNNQSGSIKMPPTTYKLTGNVSNMFPANFFLDQVNSYVKNAHFTTWYPNNLTNESGSNGWEVQQSSTDLGSVMSGTFIYSSDDGLKSCEVDWNVTNGVLTAENTITASADNYQCETTLSSSGSTSNLVTSFNAGGTVLLTGSTLTGIPTTGVAGNPPVTIAYSITNDGNVPSALPDLVDLLLVNSSDPAVATIQVDGTTCPTPPAQLEVGATCQVDGSVFFLAAGSSELSADLQDTDGNTFLSDFATLTLTS